MGQFGVGQSVTRLEDQRLLTGDGRYTDDFHLEGQAHAMVVRSPHAHAELKEIDTAEAAQMPGVLAVLTAEDLSKAGVKDIPCLAAIPGKDGNPPVMPGHPVLARGRVRHVGDPVAFVVAETAAQARDAAEAVFVDYEDLPAVVDTRGALDDEAPQIWDDAKNNVALDWEIGDKAATEDAFSKADRVVALELVNNRVVVNSMEPRVALGSYDDEAGRFELITSTQGSHNLRNQIAEKVLGVEKDKVHVSTPDVGGGFGMKIFLYPEQVLVLVAAKQIGRPVRWVSERSEAFLTDNQGRDHVSHAELALDGDKNILGLRVSTVAGLGAYLSNFAPYIPTAAGAKMLSGLYRIPAIYCEVKCVFTNTVPVDAYRGAGRPEASYLVERLIDYVAGEVCLSPPDFRKRNFIRPDDLPYDTG
ncbi:MAG: xanthine dehydrogenase family protein molybdopterin-binding subunit, partial [Rhodovibrionaceae bacterium]|nr:xanthine dehydrogenase family protein molybdopterin-binding subunit [Rhodovibrionaceae bacterium]